MMLYFKYPVQTPVDPRLLWAQTFLEMRAVARGEALCDAPLQLLAGYQLFYCVNCFMLVKLICDTIINYYLLTYLLTYLYIYNV